jgi:hypothetical protein
MMSGKNFKILVMGIVVVTLAIIISITMYFIIYKDTYILKCPDGTEERVYTPKELYKVSENKIIFDGITVTFSKNSNSINEVKIGKTVVEPILFNNISDEIRGLDTLQYLSHQLLNLPGFRCSKPVDSRIITFIGLDNLVRSTTHDLLILVKSKQATPDEIKIAYNRIIDIKDQMKNFYTNLSTLNNDAKYTSNEFTNKAIAHYKISKKEHSENENLDQVVKNEFGKNAQVADWSIIKSQFPNINDVVRFMNEVQIIQTGEYFIVQWNGDKRWAWDKSRQFFLTRHNGNLPTDHNFLAHDNIGNFQLSLGSWRGLSHKILVYIP